MNTLSSEEIRHLCGDVPDWKIARIVVSGATIEDLEVALSWAAGESDVLGKAHQPLSGVAAEVYEILLAGEEWEEDRVTPG